MSSRFYDINERGEVVYQHTHNGREYPFTASSLHQRGSQFIQRAKNFLKKHQTVGSRKAHVYHNAEAAGITCLRSETKETLK